MQWQSSKSGGSHWSLSVPPRWLSREASTVVHAAPAAIVTLWGLPPTSIVWSTCPVSALSRETVPSAAFATHTQPASAAIPVGSEPTCTVLVTALASGSIRDTVPSTRFATQTAPSPKARPAGAVADRDGFGDPLGVRFDARDGPRPLVGHP